MDYVANLTGTLFQRLLFPLLLSKITMSPFPPIHSSKLSAFSTAALNEVKELHYSKSNFKIQDSNGAFIGTFGPLSYVSLLMSTLFLSLLLRSSTFSDAPSVIQPFLHLASETIKHPAIKPRTGELAVLAIAAVYRALYVVYAHARIVSRAGLSDMEILSASKGEMSSGLSGEEAITFDTGLKLARGRGPLDEESRASVHAELGSEGAAALAALVAGYVHT